MANFKIVLADPKTRLTYQKEVEQKASGLIGKKLGDVVDGGSLGLGGYKLELTGGSDKDGFPMRKDVDGAAKKHLLLSAGPGFRSDHPGLRKRKSIRGNTISDAIIQVNTKVLQTGTKTIAESWNVAVKAPKKAEKTAEEKPAEKETAPAAEEKPAETVSGEKEAPAGKKEAAEAQEHKKEGAPAEKK